MATRRTSAAFTDALPELLREKDMSLRALAQMVGVGNDHLSRVLRGARGKSPSADLVRRVSVALGLPADFFPEARAAFVAERLSEDPVLRDQVYDQLQRGLAPRD